MAGGCCLTATWQNKFLEWRQIFVESVEVLLQPGDELGLHRLVPGYAEFATQFEKIVLDLREAATNVIRHGSEAEHDADGAIRLVNGAIGLHPWTVLVDTAAVTEAGGTIVTGFGVNLAQAMTHESPLICVCVGTSCPHYKLTPAPVARTCFWNRHRP
jgi:hypothetical protein